MAPIPKSSGVPGKWAHDLCGCFDDFGICIKSYFCPCIVFGKVAEKTGENCMKCGIFTFIPLLNIVALIKIRGKVREMKGIEGGSTCDDLLTYMCCPFCTFTQTANEVLLDDETPAVTGQGQEMERQ